MVTWPKDGQLFAPKSVVTEKDDPSRKQVVRDRSERRPESIMNNAG